MTVPPGGGLIPQTLRRAVTTLVFGRSQWKPAMQTPGWSAQRHQPFARGGLTFGFPRATSPKPASGFGLATPLGSARPLTREAKACPIMVPLGTPTGL